MGVRDKAGQEESGFLNFRLRLYCGHRHTDTQTHGHTDTQTQTHTNAQTHGHTDTQTQTHTNAQTHNQRASLRGGTRPHLCDIDRIEANAEAELEEVVLAWDVLLQQLLVKHHPLTLALHVQMQCNRARANVCVCVCW